MVLGTKKGYWYGALSFQQYLYQDPDDPKIGWGAFGQVAISDGNPNPFESSYYFGVGGNSFLPDRKQDRWGIAHFRYNYSRDLISGLAGLGAFIRDEWGFEAYYNAEILPGVFTTLDLQYVRPTTVGKENAIIGAIRTQIKF